jgi:hypothetical protein
MELQAALAQLFFPISLEHPLNRLRKHYDANPAKTMPVGHLMFLLSRPLPAGPIRILQLIEQDEPV